MGLTRHRIRDGVAFFQMGGMILSLFPRPSAEEDSGISFGNGTSRVYLAYNTRSEEEVDAVLALVRDVWRQHRQASRPRLLGRLVRLFR